MSFPRYPEYKDSGVEWLGEVPAHWGVRPLKHLARLTTGMTPPTDEHANYDDSGFPWIRPEDLDESGAITRSSKFLSEKGKALAREIQPGASLICCIGTIGKVGIVDESVSTNQQITAANFSGNDRYFYFVTCAARNELEITATGNVLKILNTERLGEVKYSVPPLAEQTAIATFLDHETAKIDALVAEQEKLIALLQEKRQAVISHAVTKGLDPNVPMKDSGVEWLGEVPAHWEIRRVRALSSFLTSGPRGWSERVSEVGSKFIQSGDLTDDLSIAFDNAKRVAVNDDAEAARTKLADGDVVVCITGAKTGNVAVCGTVAEDAYVNQHLCLIRPRPDILSDLLAIYLKSDAGQRYFAVAQYGLKQGMSLENIKEAPVPVPPIDEQRQIVDVAQDASRSIGALVNEARTAITLLQERRTALISAAVIGQIDVRGLAGASNAPDSIAVSA